MPTREEGIRNQRQEDDCVWQDSSKVLCGVHDSSVLLVTVYTVNK